MNEAVPRSGGLGILFLVMLITGAGNTALQSILPSLGRIIGVPDTVISAVFSVSALIWVFSAPYWARRSDHQGRRRIVIIGITGFTVSTYLVGILLFAGLQGWLTPLVTMVCVIMARMIFGIFGSAAPPAAQAMVVLATPREERVKALTLLGSAFGLGTLVGLALAPLLVLPYLGLSAPPFVFATFGLFTLFAILRFLPDDSQHDGEGAHGANVSYPSIGGAPAGASITAATSERVDEKLSLFDERIRAWMILGFLMGHAQAIAGAVMGFLVIDRLGLDPRDIVTQQTTVQVLMAGAGAALLVQWGLIPRLNWSPRTMMLVGISIAVAGLALNSYANTLYSISMAYALGSIGFGFTRPAFTAGSSLAVNRRLQGLVAGRVTSVNGASFVLAPTIGVALYQIEKSLPFLLAAMVMALTIPFAWRYLRSEAQ